MQVRNYIHIFTVQNVLEYLQQDQVDPEDPLLLSIQLDPETENKLFLNQLFNYIVLFSAEMQIIKVDEGVNCMID